MKRKPTSWRVLALGSLVAFAVVALGAGAGQSALGGGSQAGVLVSGTTDSITNIDPAGNYDFGTFSLGINMYEHLYDAKNGAKLVPSLATGCAPRGNTRTWRCTLRRGVHVPRRLGLRLGRRQVLVRSGLQRADREAGRCQHAVVTAVQPQERHDEREVRRHVQPQGAGIDLAVHPRHRGRRDRPQRRVQGEQSAGEQPASDRHWAVSVDEVHAGPAGRVRALRRLLGPAGEERRLDPPLLLEVVDDEARASAGRDRHGVPDVHPDRACLTRRGAQHPRAPGAGRDHPLSHHERRACAVRQRRRCAGRSRT